MADTKDTNETGGAEDANATDDAKAPRRSRERRPARQRTGPSGVARVRTVLAQIIWTVALIAALILALGALLVAVKANQDNALVKFLLHAADAVDLGLFDRDNGIKQFHGSNAATKDALFNWGIGALVYLVVGRIVDRIIRPRS